MMNQKNLHKNIMNEFNSIKLENQLCFPLYAYSKEIPTHIAACVDLKGEEATQLYKILSGFSE